MAIQPQDEEPVVAFGAVRNVTMKSDPFKAFNLPDTAIARVMLGERWAEPVGKVTIHEPSAGSEQFRSYTAWVPSAFLADARVDVAAAARLASVQIPGYGPVWFCDRLDV